MKHENRLARAAMLSLLAVACGGGDRERASASDGDVAGGQTGEFSGGTIEFCPETVSDTSLALDAPDVAEWVALVAGHHELSLGWRRLFATDAVTGFDEHTRLSLDVSVLRARELLFGTGGDGGYEISGCAGLRVRQFEVEGSLETADGALRGDFRQWLQAERDPNAPGGRRLITANLREEMNGSYSLSDFESTIDLGIEVGATVSRHLGVWLGFDAESAHGRLGPALVLSRPGQADASWSPLEGTFPDTGCGSELLARPLPLDEHSAALGETPRAAFERIRGSWQSTREAAWQHPGRDGEPPRILSRTEVEIRLGDPTHACIIGETSRVHTVIDVVTADGAVNLTHPAALSVQPGRSPGLGFESAWIPSADFEVVMGLRGVELGSGEYGALRLHHDDNGDGEVVGSLVVHEWADFERRFIDHPELEWCSGEDCSFFWCGLETSNPQDCPSSL